MGKCISDLVCNRPAITDQLKVVIILANDASISQTVIVVRTLPWFLYDLQTNFHFYETATTYSFSFRFYSFPQGRNKLACTWNRNDNLKLLQACVFYDYFCVYIFTVSLAVCEKLNLKYGQTYTVNYKI